MKKIVEKNFTGNSSYGIPYVAALTLECGHKVMRGEAGNGGFEAYQKAKYQKRAKCPECEK